MPEIRMTRRLAAAAGALSMLGAYATVAVASTEGPMGTIYPVSFPPGSTTLHQADQETIHGVAAMMERNPALVATVLGKADTMGTADFNEHLSWKRASAVFEALVFNYNVPANRVDMRWTVDRLPVVPTGDETAELQNRIVEIILK